MPWVDIYAVPSGIVTSESGIVTDESGNHPKSVTIGRIRRSRSAGLAGHVAPDSAVTFGRNTQPGKHPTREIDLLHSALSSAFASWAREGSRNEVNGAPRTTCACIGPQQKDSWTLQRFESAANRRHGHRLRPTPPMRASATNGSPHTRESSDSFRLSPTTKQ